MLPMRTAQWSLESLKPAHCRQLASSKPPALVWCWQAPTVRRLEQATYCLPEVELAQRAAPLRPWSAFGAHTTLTAAHLANLCYRQERRADLSKVPCVSHWNAAREQAARDQTGARVTRLETRQAS